MKKNWAGLLAVCLLLASCGQTGSAGTTEEQSVSSSVQDQVTNWKTDRWVCDNGSVASSPLYAGEMIKGLDMSLQNYSGRSVNCCTRGNTIYSLQSYFWQQSEDKWKKEYYLCSYDGDTGEIRQLPLDLSGLEGYAEQEMRVVNLDIQSDQELVAFVQGWQEGMSCTVSYQAVHMTPEGKLLSAADLYPVLSKMGMDSAIPFSDSYVDAAGNYYMIPWKESLLEKTQVMILDAAGETVGTMEAEEGYAWAEWAMKLPDGSPVFAWKNYDLQNVQLVTYDAEGRRSHILLQQKGLMDAGLWMVTEDGYLYYVDDADELMRCDIRSGAREECLYYPQLGLGTDKYSARMIPGKDGLPEILGESNGETVICRLSRESSEVGPVQMISLTPYCEYFQKCAAEISQGNKEHPIYVQSPAESNDTAYRDRVMVELASGEGADLYYVTAEDMRILAEKGMLADLTELISPDTLSAIYPGVLETGTLDGKLCGIAVEEYGYAMFVSRELWPEDSWTLEEALDVMEANSQLQYPVMSTGTLDCYGVFQYLVIDNLACSPFLNLEEGTCDFTNPLFARALELAGSYQQKISYEEVQEIYPGKDWVALQTTIPFPTSYYELMTVLGEDYHAVGYPVEEGNGNFWCGYRFLVVNQDTAHREEIAAYLEALLSEENLKEYNYAVRKEDLTGKVGDIEIPDKIANGEMTYKTTTGIAYDNGVYFEVLPDEDGHYWVEDYEELLESLSGRSAAAGAVEDIIWEEVESYFSGDRDAAAVADTVQNRVQLYLNERQ